MRHELCIVMKNNANIAGVAETMNAIPSYARFDFGVWSYDHDYELEGRVCLISTNNHLIDIYDDVIFFSTSIIYNDIFGEKGIGARILFGYFRRVMSAFKADRSIFLLQGSKQYAAIEAVVIEDRGFDEFILYLRSNFGEPVKELNKIYALKDKYRRHRYYELALA